MKYIHRLTTILMAMLFFTVTSAQEKGKASYYSQSLHGRRMSDGTKYHRDSMVCAHKRYPLGTILKVTNLNNDKSVIVRVADRGPHVRGRIIDLSYRAAKEIGMIASGIAMVRVEPYHGEVAIPFKPVDEAPEIPELDFEISRDGYDYVPQWQKPKEEKPVSVEERREIIKDEKKLSEVKKEIAPPMPKETKEGRKKTTTGVSHSNPHKASQRH
jgi:rare lipoprotein A